MKLYRKFKQAASGTASAIGNAASSTYQYGATVTRKTGELAGSLANRAANITDLRKILGILDYIPFIPEKEIDRDTLATSLAFLQMGNLTVLSSYDSAEGPDVTVLRMDKVSARKANETTGDNHFMSMVLSETDNPDEPNIHLVINKENFLNNHRHLTADLIVEGLVQPVNRIPVVGGPASRILAVPGRAIARYLINTIYNQVENVAGLFISDKTTAEPEPDPGPNQSSSDNPSPPAPGAP